MLRYFMNISIIFVTLFAVSVYSIKPGPRYPPTKGEVWPKPQQENKENKYYVIDPAHFKVKVTNETCAILTNAVSRYIYLVRNKNRNVPHRRGRRISKTKQRRRLLRSGIYANVQDENFLGALWELSVELTNPCEEYPYFEMDESYNLTVSTISKLQSSSIWGILRGLETFAQLFYLTDDYNELRINKTHIIDYPQYAHRGLLLDTSRHYISLTNLLLTLDAMAMNKMNVLHWHIVDDESFPYQSEKFPELSEQGAYHPSMVYTKNDIKRVIDFARDRGIRVIPEIDIPGHTRSWGVAYPNILTECYNGAEVVGLGPMNPINNVTYKLLRDLFAEIQEWFPDKYFHVGGDEVDLSCWISNPELLEYMSEHNMSSPNDLHSLFMRNVIPLLENESIPIVWQEVFDEGVTLSKDTLIQVWKNNWINEMIKVLSAGHRVLFSASWYLDRLNSGGDWEKFYEADPRQMVNNDTLGENIAGGEACMWGEVVDDRNVISRVWPRASAVAEKLWSAPVPTTYASERDALAAARLRLEEHACRMARRGVHAQPPNGPGFCLA